MFSRLGEYRGLKAERKELSAVLGCVAQQEGEDIFKRAPWVSLVCGSASYRKLPELLAQVEAGKQRVTGLDNDTDETFETEMTRRDNPWRAYLTIIEGCDKACAYCVVPYTRGPERSRDSEPHFAGSAATGGSWLFRSAVAGADCKFLRRSFTKKNAFQRAIAGSGTSTGNPARAVHDLASEGFWLRHHRSDGCAPGICNHVHLPVQSGSSARFASDAEDVFARGISGKDCHDSRCQAARSALLRTSLWAFPAKRMRISMRRCSCWMRCSTTECIRFKYSPRPNTPATSMADAIPEEEKSRRLAAAAGKAAGRFRRKHCERLVGEEFEVHVDGKSKKENQWSGHTSCNRVLSLTSAQTDLLGR